MAARRGQRALARHSSGNSRPPRALPRARRRASCRLRSAAARAVRPRFSSSSSAARSSARARSSPGVAAQAENPAAAAAIAARAIASSPSRTEPMTRPSIGEITARSMPGSATPSTSGAASAGTCRAGANLGQQRVEARALAEFDAGGVSPLRLIEIARQRDFWIARLAWIANRGFADGAESPRSARSDRRRPTRTRSWRRFPAAAAPDKRADRGGRRPAHRRGRRHRAIRPAAPHKAPRPCHAAAGTRSPSTPPASSITLATVSALWVANCGNMRSRAARSFLTQAM